MKPTGRTLVLISCELSGRGVGGVYINVNTLPVW